MWIKRIELINWKAFAQAVFNIPRRDPRSNVVVIGAKNGVGKTSLLEAITLCLFGDKGLRYIAHENKSYGEFISGTFHSLADLSSPKAQVSLLFEIGDGKEVSVTRTWHFGTNRQFREEELRIQENGADIPIPLTTQRESYLASHIAEQFLPHSLSPFFLLDAGRVRQMAQMEMSEQVRDGIEGVLGVPTLRSLIANLHAYASTRRGQGMVGRSHEKLGALQQNIETHEAQTKRLNNELLSIGDGIKRARIELDGMTQKYMGMDGDNVEKLGDLRQESEQLHQSINASTDKLVKAIVGDFSLALSGPIMLKAVVTRLQAESKRVEWEHDKKRGTKSYGKFLDNLNRLNALASISLSGDQKTQLLKNIELAWNDLWHPMPSDCAHKLLNPGFSDGDRSAAIQRFSDLSEFGVSRIKSLLKERNAAEKNKSSVDRQLHNIRGDRAKEVRQLHQQMEEKRAEISQLEKTNGDREREKESAEKELARLRQEFGRETTQRRDKDPILRRSTQAEKAVQMIEQIIGQSYSCHVSNIAEKMTHAYTRMASKKIVSEIQIDDDCNIELLTSEGTNIRKLQNSHAEMQIFALALIAAIARVANNPFPFVIDTPVGNLGTEHRDKFLRYFSSEMDNQVFLLSHDAEIRGEEMNLIRPRIARKFLVAREYQNRGVHRNLVRADQYFEETGE